METNVPVKGSHEAYMKKHIKSKCWSKAGRIYCDKHKTWCASIDMKTGKCNSVSCSKKQKRENNLDGIC